MLIEEGKFLLNVLTNTTLEKEVLHAGFMVNIDEKLVIEVSQEKKKIIFKLYDSTTRTEIYEFTLTQFINILRSNNVKKSTVTQEDKFKEYVREHVKPRKEFKKQSNAKPPREDSGQAAKTKPGASNARKPVVKKPRGRPRKDT